MPLRHALHGFSRMSKTFVQYKNKWAPYSLNKEFWREVLVGRTITSVEFDDYGVSSIALDNGETVYVPGYSRRLYIKAEVDRCVMLSLDADTGSEDV